MTSEELVGRLETRKDDELRPQAANEELCRFFVFSVGESLYALPPASIHEIVSDLEVFPIPACPPYVPGLINCHGIPHTVFDLMVLFNNERLPTDQFLILNLEDDSVAFGCTEVKEIVEIPVHEISTFPEKNPDTLFFSAMFTFAERRVPVLAVGQILRKLEGDFA